MDENLKLSDDEDDLEALRRAALQTIKKKQLGEARAPNFAFGGSPGRLRRGNGKFRGGGVQWGARNGNQNWGPPAINTNLISIPVVSNNNHRCHQQPMSNHHQQKQPPLLSQQSSPPPKLILPQDRYCNKNDNSTKPNEGGGSKFDRYDNSDDESEDSDDDDGDEDDDELNSSSPKNGMKRSTSLDALMEELENEIQGGGNGKEKEPSKEDKVKSPVVKKRKRAVVAVQNEEKVKEAVKEEVVVEVAKSEKEEEKVVVKNLPPLMPQMHKRREFVRNNTRKWSKPPPLLPPPQQQPLPLPPQLFGPPPIFYQQPPPQYAPPPMPMYEAPPPMLPPLMISTESYHGTQPPIMAPLSPRSAAFVLENRAIIEKRKRRSYSRSPSPRRRRSKSPLPQRRRSSSPPPPKQRPLSPKPRPLPPAPKKPPIRDRLGTKPSSSSTTKPIKPPSEPTDPVLEARKKKFESNELKIKEGVIRLKSSESKAVPEPETSKKAAPPPNHDDLDEDALLDGDDLEFDLDIQSDVHLFSDEEESDSDNEGRFKTKLGSGGIAHRVGVLPFTKLTSSGARKEAKSELRNNSRSPLRSRQQQVKATPPVLDNRKIEIKLKNPAKYEEKNDESSRSGESTKRNNEDRVVVASLRKVELGRRPATPEADENNGCGGGNGAPESDEGDLRAQLSRKRAERQQKQPSSLHAVVDAAVPTRLLQTALQSVGFKNSGTSRKSSSSRAGKGKTKKNENKEGKLPIHLRLGAAAALSSDVQFVTTSTTSPVAKKSRKHKRVGAGTGGSTSAGGVGGASPSVEDKV